MRKPSSGQGGAILGGTTISLVTNQRIWQGGAFEKLCVCLAGHFNGAASAGRQGVLYTTYPSPNQAQACTSVGE